jgi:hypothetical protein
MYTVTVEGEKRRSTKTFDDFNTSLQDAMLAWYLVGNMTNIQISDEDGKVLWSNKELEGEDDVDK